MNKALIFDAAFLFQEIEPFETAFPQLRLEYRELVEQIVIDASNFHEASIDGRELSLHLAYPETVRTEELDLLRTIPPCARMSEINPLLDEGFHANSREELALAQPLSFKDVQSQLDWDLGINDPGNCLLVTPDPQLLAVALHNGMTVIDAQNDPLTLETRIRAEVFKGWQADPDYPTETLGERTGPAKGQFPPFSIG